MIIYGAKMLYIKNDITHPVKRDVSSRSLALLLICLICAACQSLSFRPPPGNCFTSETANYEELRDYVNDRDPTKLADWLKKAASANHAAAIHQIARTYVNDQQYDKAYLWYEKGVRLGDYQSMYDLGVMWLKGEGRDIDLSKAYAWFLLTGEYIPTYWDDYFFPLSMIKWHKSLATNLSKRMTAEQIQTGERYYKEEKKGIECNWYSWYGAYIMSSNKRP
jgi:hypothetical protein